MNGVRRISKKESAFAIILSVISLFVIPALAQAPSRLPKKSGSHRRLVTLETVLSCADDPLIGDIFKTDKLTANIKLDALLMVEMKFKTLSADYIDLRSKGFVTRPLQDSTLQIMPTNPLSGVPIPESNLTFCHDLPAAHYDEADNKSGPRDVDIGGEDWVLNPNEIFAHADQFHFDSGVFTNSSDVFFTAIKGRVSIEFLCKTEGLKFYRAIYLPGD